MVDDLQDEFSVLVASMASLLDAYKMDSDVADAVVKSRARSKATLCFIQTTFQNGELIYAYLNMSTSTINNSIVTR